MINRMSWLFHLISGISVIALTLSFFGIGREFIHSYFMWFLAFLWIGMIGNYFIERNGKSAKKG